MYQNKIKFVPQDILEKRFKIDTRGYRMKEVDQYLDDIISDYEQFFEIINNLDCKLNMEVASSTKGSGEVTNVDIMRRLSQLEKAVYGIIKQDEDDNVGENN